MNKAKRNITNKIRRKKGYFVKYSFQSEFVDLMERLYKKYGEEIFAIQGIANSHLDIANFSKTFFTNSIDGNVADVSVDGNANVNQKDIVAYEHESGKPSKRLNAMYLIYKYVKKHFDEKSADEAVEKIINGEVFVNDLHAFNMPYCYAFDLDKLITDGIDYYKGNFEVHKPKRLFSFINLIIQLTSSLSNQVAGAVSYPNFFVILDWFMRKEYGDDYIDNFFKTDLYLDKKKDVLNQFQNIIMSLNWSFRGNQSAFVNISVMDMGFLTHLFKGYVYPDMTEPKFDSVLELSKAFFEHYNDMNCNEGMFTFPVMTLAASIDPETKKTDTEFLQWCSKYNHEKSLANIFIDYPDSFSSCCRMRNDFSKISDNGYTNSFGVGGVSIGSLRVAGLNLPRISLLEKDNPNILEEDLEICHKILYAHRKLIKDRITGGYLPLFDYGWIVESKQYSTIGFIGGYEYCLNKGINIVENTEPLTELLKKAESKIIEWQTAEKAEKISYNVEQIPGESMAVRLAKIDSIIGYNPNNFKLYSNQYVPLIDNASIYDRLRIQGKFDQLTSGGAICHLNFDDSESLTEEQYFRLIETAVELGVKYFTVNYAFSKCAKGHYTIGNVTDCPVCKCKIVKKFSRVVGFLTPISSWNEVRREFEFPHRVFYNHNNINI